jgi:hypothetical protein
VLETKRGVGAIDWKLGSKYLWRPDLRPKLKDWVVDFALAGQAALDGPHLASRMVMFRLYYLGLAEYGPRASLSGFKRAQLGELVRGSAPEVWRRTAAPGDVPPRKYFNGAHD